MGSRGSDSCSSSSRSTMSSPRRSSKTALPGLAAMTTSGAWTIPLDELRDQLAPTVGQQPDAKEAKRKIYRRSADPKVYVLREAAGVCEGCASPAPFLTR